jgi:hypothetical protein
MMAQLERVVPMSRSSTSVIPPSYDLEFYRFDTPRQSFRLRGDLSTHAPLMQIRDGTDGAVLADLTSSIIATLEPAVGSVPIKTAFRFRGLTAPEILAIKAANDPRYDFQLVSGSGPTAITRTYIRGRISVTSDVSRTA